jgi:Xaa-Pro aminopeptidase
MKKEFYQANRQHLGALLPEHSLAIFFAGVAPRKTNDEDYPFFANRDFVYLTGIEQAQSIIVIGKENGQISEKIFVLPPSILAERWRGYRLKDAEINAIAGIEQIAYLAEFDAFMASALQNSPHVFLDYNPATPAEGSVTKYTKYLRESYPFVTIHNSNPLLRQLRTIKTAEEITALKQSEQITREAIIAMMQATKAGLFEYQIKAEYDYVLTQHGMLSPGFPSIISAGRNNFYIHYYRYLGQLQAGDLVLNDVGVAYDKLTSDVSRAYPVNGKFSEKQKLLYQIVFDVSNEMFATLAPGFAMKEVDATIRRKVFERLKEIRVCHSWKDIGTYMWHGGAHHIGFDVHDTIREVDQIEANMAFCIDIGIYHEKWGIGFRLEDNCLITPNGCENLSAAIPREMKEIEGIVGTKIY